ncbi:hypothetical protein DdX_16530 [Ditylenchus destructor]|uniref:Uncharacterized protein n=1 Tax=Ditylenchus destructor TaxID=166010 RepID=A0AAD4MTD5_9BILA|nr:hypothetical protein DdX_16530 [Ditylenchus destructor]
MKIYLLCAITQLLFCNTVANVYGSLLRRFWPQVPKRNYVLANPSDKIPELSITSMIVPEDPWITITKISNFQAETKYGNPGDIPDAEIEPISFNEFERRADLVYKILFRHLFRGMRIDGLELKETQKEIMYEEITELMPAKPVTEHSVIAIEMPRNKLSELDVLEHCKESNSFPLLTTNDIVHCIEKKYYPIALELSRTPVSEKTEKVKSLKIKVDFELKQGTANLLKELKKSKVNSMTVEEFASGIEIYIGYMDKYKGLTFEDGSRLDTLQGGLTYISKAWELKGKLLASQVKHLIQRMKDLGHRHWRWEEKEKKVLPSDMPQGKGELLLEVLEARVKDLEKLTIVMEKRLKV